MIPMRTMASHSVGKILQEKQKNPTTRNGTRENITMSPSSGIHPWERNPTSVWNVGKASVIVLICELTRGPTQEKSLTSALSVRNASVIVLT